MFGVGLIIYCLLFVLRTPEAENSLASRDSEPSQWHSARLLNNLSLTEEQCEAAFPGLTWSIDDVVSQGPFSIKPTSNLGPVVSRIKDGKVSDVPASR